MSGLVRDTSVLQIVSLGLRLVRVRLSVWAHGSLGTLRTKNKQKEKKKKQKKRRRQRGGGQEKGKKTKKRTGRQI